ncbi:MAG: sigma 54-interacting transcriptional regulator [Peptococcaceae bacterium]|nr:sigma 54-interacting transcriptional regulator [Peptococcaceae bacterium]
MAVLDPKKPGSFKRDKKAENQGLDSLLSLFPDESESKIRWLANILNSIYDSVLVVDAGSTILFANPSYTRTFGVPVQKVLGRKLSDIEPGSQILKVLETGKPIVDDKQWINSVGIYIVTNITPVYDGDKLAGAVAVFRDASEMLVLQEKLKKTEHEVNKVKNLSERYFSEVLELRNRMLEIKDMVFESPQIKRVLDMVLRVATVDSTVLVTGETGVGKEIFAKIIHRGSRRSNGPFVAVNCGAIPENILESELFGYEKGAFTGAGKDGKIGLMEVAQGGTLFLDEIADLPLGLQVKLLRVLQERKITRVGGLRPIDVDIRIIAATNKDLKDMVKQRIFREDLYYRLNVVPISIPPLRERKEDIVPLTQFFLQKYNKKFSASKRLTTEVFHFFETYAWPGNVREMENLIERLVVCSKYPEITLNDETILEYFGERICNEGQIAFDGMMELQEARSIVEKQLIKKAIDFYGSARKAAGALGVDHSTILRKAKKYGISVNKDNN